MDSDPRKRKSGETKNYPYQSSLFQTHPDRDNAASAQQSTNNKEQPKADMLKKIYAVCFKGKSAAWTAIFTCVLSVLSFLLYKVNEEATSASVASQRAFLSFSGYPMEKVQTMGDDPMVTGYRFHVPIVNSGSTPTRYSVEEISLAIQDTAPTQDTDFEGLPHSERFRTIFSPHQVWDIPPVEVSMADMLSLEQGRRHIFLWGWVVYRDIFPSTPVHLAEFCTELSRPKWTAPAHSDPHTDVNVTVLPCATHNCYDEDCRDYLTRIAIR